MNGGGTFTIDDSHVFVIPHGYTLVGTCGNCGGPVLRSSVFASWAAPPTARCQRCGKQAKAKITAQFGEVLSME